MIKLVKKWIAACAATTFLLSLISVSAWAMMKYPGMDVVVNGKTYSDIEVLEYEGELYLSLTQVENLLKQDTVYNEEVKTIYINDKKTSAREQKAWNQEGSPEVPFDFDYLRLTLGDDVDWTSVENKYSDYDGREVFKIPVKVLNTGNEKHKLSRSNVRVYGPSGEELKDINAYFSDSFVKMGSVKTGKYTDTFLYGLYAGPGVYRIEFDNKYENCQVKWYLE